MGDSRTLHEPSVRIRLVLLTVRRYRRALSAGTGQTRKMGKSVSCNESLDGGHYRAKRAKGVLGGEA